MRVSERSTYPWEPEGVRVRMETPEQIEIEFRVAPFSARLVGAFLDQLLIAIVTFLVFIGILIAGNTHETSAFLTGLAMAVAFLLQMFYFVALELGTGGQTPGKRAVRCRALSTTGQPLTVGAALLRNLARVVDNIPVAWIVPALNPARRRIGDFLAGTLVVMVDDRTSTEVRTLEGQSYRELVDRRFPLGPEHASRLVKDDLDLLTYFFKNTYRLHTSSHEVKAIPRQIAARYVKRLDLQDQLAAVQEHPVRFLQELYLFLKEQLEPEVF